MHQEIRTHGKSRIGLIGWVAITLSSATLMAAGLLVYLIATAEERKPKALVRPEADPNLIVQEADDRFLLSLHKAVLHGDSVALEHRAIGEVIGGLKTVDDRVSWRLKLKKPGIYQIHYTYSNALEPGAALGKVRFTCGDAAITAPLRLSGGAQASVTDTQFLLLEPKGEVTFELSIAAPGEGELLALKKIELIPHLRQKHRN